MSDDRAMLETRHRGLLLLGVMLVSICQFLDATIANIALPHMKSALGASTDTISWVLTSFMIATAVGTPLTGWLSDRIGSRRLFISANVMFLLTSAACGASTSLAEMVIFRTLQGLSAAFIGPMTMTIMFDISPRSKQAMTMAVYSMIVMLAPISGPFLGGLLTEYLNWRWIYYVNLPLGIPALVLIWWLLPSRPIVRRQLDLVGFGFIALALTAMQLMLDRGQHLDWFSSWEVVIELIIALSALWIFIIHSRYTPHPLFNRAVFANGNFVISLGFMGVLGVAAVGLSAILPMLFQSIYGYPVVEAGMLMAPRGFGVMFSSLAAGVLARRMDVRYLIVCGYLIAAGSMWYMTSWGLVMGVPPILVASFVQGFGLGAVMSSMNLLAFATLEPELRPDGSSLMSLFRSLGGAIGISVIFNVLARSQQTSHADLAAHITGDTLPAVDLPAVVDRLQGLGAGVMMAIDGEVNRQALMIAFLDNFYMLAWLLLAFSPLSLLLRKPRNSADSLPLAGE